jgi:tetraacyldisaccharide 4'-kinase
MKYLRFILFPISLIYIVITSFRNWLFDVKIKREFRFSLPIINIGNLSMGGTGKTPHTEYLIRLLKNNHKLATLSRGFGRKEFGFKIADDESTSKQIGDEPLQFYKKFGKDITVAVESDRVKGVMDICYAKEETDLVLLDDAYQHRAINPGFNILLTDYNKPFFSDYVLPVGNLRELRKGKKRADVIVVTKCVDFESVDKGYLIDKIRPNNGQKVYFSKVVYGLIQPFNTEMSSLNNSSQNVILVTGIASPKPLFDHLHKTHDILEHCKFNDHYQFNEKDIDDIHNLLVKFADKKPIIITTEKDAMRLIGGSFESEILKQPWFYQTIEVEIDNKEEFDKEILNYVQKNRRDY